MGLWMLILCVIPTIVTTITISPNGNSPETKMVGGMMVEVQHTVPPVTSKPDEAVTNKYEIKRSFKNNSTKLAINERYRRLIPYMTFYYANDLVSPTTEAYNTNNVEVAKAEIVEAGTIAPNERQPKVIYSSPRHKNIPRYQGNRLTQYNIASANPGKFYYKEVPVVYQNAPKTSYNYNPFSEHRIPNRDFAYDRFIPKQIKAPSAPFTPPTRKPYVSFYQNQESPNVQYYSSEREESQKYKLIPYEQTPPVKLLAQDVNNAATPLKQHDELVHVPKEHVYIKPRPSLYPQYIYETINSQPSKTRKPPATISEIYYEKQPHVSSVAEHVIESGFRPIIHTTESTKTLVYEHQEPEDVPYRNVNNYDKQKELEITETVTVAPERSTYSPQYTVEQQAYKPEKYETSNSVTLAELLNSLQINKSIPKPITRENIGASIRTLLQVLTALKAVPNQNDVESSVVSTPKPFESSESPEGFRHTTPNSVLTTTPRPSVPDLQEEAYLAPINTPSQHIDEYPTGGGSSQQFPLPITSDDEGGTPGRPGVDYPILTVIPPTRFDCKTQRYKGFFADTETRCQVWHYCDLNGGQASFLCPNGTIFSQAALTCDWWFNVRCASTAQLYVLNESLYKYILPHSPKFPEDYSGPLVDKYLTLKFKEMEEQFKKNKKKKIASEKMDSDDDSTEDSEDEDISTEENVGIDSPKESAINQADVIVQSSGNSGNVQRLQDEK